MRMNFRYQTRLPLDTSGQPRDSSLRYNASKEKESGKLHMLEDLGVQINQVNAKDYKSGYLTIADTIKPGIVKLLKAKDYKGMYKMSLKPWFT